MVDVAAFPPLIVALVLATLAIWVLATDPRNIVHRGFAVFMAALIADRVIVATHSETTWLPGQLTGYVSWAVVITAVNFCILFVTHCVGGRIPRWARLARWGLGAAFVSVCLLLMAYPTAYFDWNAGELGKAGPLYVIDDLAVAIFAGVAAAGAYGSWKHPSGNDRDALVPFTMGFGALTAYRVAFATPYITFDFTSAWTNISYAVSLAVSVALLGLTAWLMAQRDHPEKRRHLTIMLWLFAAAAVSGLAVTLSLSFDSPLTILRMRLASAVWWLLMAALVVYAMLRYQLFKLDIHVKATLRASLTATPFALVFWAAQELLETQVPEGTLPLPSSLGAVAVAGLLGIVIMPIQVGARRIAEAIMPRDLEAQNYRQQRALDIYQAAYLHAVRDGELTTREVEALQNLRTGLQISRDAAASVQVAVM